MKRENTIKENVEFLLKMYKRELEYYTHKEKLNEEDHTTIEMLECTIIELETILDFAN